MRRRKERKLENMKGDTRRRIKRKVERKEKGER
jgi:hypothetical protein